MQGCKPEDIYRLIYITEFALSPDDRSVAYVSEKLDREKDEAITNIFLTDLSTKESRQLTFSGKDGSPVFSPDCQRLAFISSREEKSQIWLLPLDGGEAWCLRTKEAVTGPLIWTPDGKSLIYSATVFSHNQEEWLPYPGAPESDRKRLIAQAEKVHREKKAEDKEEKKENAVKVITRFKYKRDGVGFFGHSRKQVFITAVPAQYKPEQEGKSRQITAGDYDHNAPALSPCGRYLAVSARRTEDADWEEKSDLWLWHIEAETPHLLYDAPGPANNPRWSPCGGYIAFVGHDNREGPSTSFHLWLLDVSGFCRGLERGAAPSPLTQAAVLNITARLDRPVSSSMGWRREKLVFLLQDRGAGCLYAVEPGGEPAPLLAEREKSVSGLRVGRERVVYRYTTPTQAEELCLLGERETRLTGLNSDYNAEMHMGAWEEFSCKSPDGTRVDCWLIYPPEFDKSNKYPLVLLIHGGPHGAYGPAYMHIAQVFAAQGYVVLYTNPRGSETYGQEFSCVIDKDWGDKDYADIMAGVDALVRRGFIDRERMFVHGWSYGGYMACWIATQTDRFAAICAGASVTNMVSGYGTSDITLADEWEYGGRPWRDCVHLLKHSPLGQVENVNTPLMLMHGENDLRVSAAQTEEFYIALRRLGKEAVMIRYPGEYHGPKRPVHRLDRLERLIAWFNYYRDKK